MCSRSSASRTVRGERRGRGRRYFAAAAVCAALVIIAACSNDDSPTAPTPTSVAGSYVMATVRGYSIPHTFTDAVGKKLTVKGGTLTMKSDGTYALNYKGTLQSASFDNVDEGTYTITGSAVSFAPTDGNPPSFTGTVKGSSMAVSFKISGAWFDLVFRGN